MTKTRDDRITRTSISEQLIDSTKLDVSAGIFLSWESRPQ